MRLTGLTLTGACLKAGHAATVGATVSVTGATRVMLELARPAGDPKGCVEASSAAGTRLLQTKASTAPGGRSATVKRGKATFSVRLTLSPRANQSSPRAACACPGGRTA